MLLAMRLRWNQGDNLYNSPITSIPPRSFISSVIILSWCARTSSANRELRAGRSAGFWITSPRLPFSPGLDFRTRWALYIFTESIYQASAGAEAPRESPKGISTYVRMVVDVIYEQLVEPRKNVTDEEIATASRHVPDKTKTTSL
jgi:hypothetical protein